MKTPDLTIYVTQKDIDSLSKKSCPVERAAQRAVKRQFGWTATAYSTRLYTHISSRTYIHPPDVARFIRDFDFREPVKPFKAILKARSFTGILAGTSDQCGGDRCDCRHYPGNECSGMADQ